MSGIWLVSTANGTPAKAYDSQLEAEREVERVKPTLAVAWWCEGVEEGAEGPESAVTGSLTAEPLVERVLSHLGLRTNAREGAA